MTSGAGFKSRPHKDAERTLQRRLERVPHTYNQDLMEYRASFHAQYGGRLASVFGLWVGLLLLLTVFPGMAILLAVFLGVPSLALPPLWLSRYVKRERILDGSGVVREDTAREDGEEAYRRSRGLTLETHSHDDSGQS